MREGNDIVLYFPSVVITLCILNFSFNIVLSVVTSSIEKQQVAILPLVFPLFPPSSIYQMAKDNGCTLKTTMTMRNPAAYVRMSKAHLDLKKSGIRPNGKWYWFFEKEVI